MKNLRLTFLGLVSLAGLAATPTASQASGLCDCFCGLFGGPCCCSRADCCSTYICCRPYNAFTPVCFGSITCNGCCPVMMQPPVVPNCGGWMPPPPYAPYGCGPTGCPAGGCDPCCGPTYSVGDGYGPGLPGPCAPQYGPPQHGMPPYGAPPYGMAPQGAPAHSMPLGPPVGQPYAQYPGMPIQQQNYTVPQQAPHNAGYQPGYQVPGYYVQPVSYYPMWPSQPVVPNYWYGR